MKHTLLVLVVVAVLATVLTSSFSTPFASPDSADAERNVRIEQIMRGRTLVINHGCGDCHGGFDNPSSDNWLVGIRNEAEGVQIGEFRTYARNLTPDDRTGMGRFSERQIFNALRFGLRPGETADVEITSITPGEGNFPLTPKYLAVPMPWPVFRHMTDEEIWDIAAYLKHGLKPVSNYVPDSEGPPDFWAGFYSSIGIGTYPPPPFPTEKERMPER
jgi:mono/diheme cytochrome c family protein